MWKYFQKKNNVTKPKDTYSEAKTELFSPINSDRNQLNYALK